LTAIILAGGKSTRVGLNKSKDQIKFAGRPLIDWVISQLTSLDNLTEEDIFEVFTKISIVKKFVDRIKDILREGSL